MTREPCNSLLRARTIKGVAWRRENGLTTRLFSGFRTLQLSFVMTVRSHEIATRIQDLPVRFGAEAMRSLQRYNEFLQRLAGGELDDAAARDAYIRFMRDETERYVRGVADISVGYYDALLDLAATYSPPFFEQAARRQQSQGPAPSAARGAIELRGLPGSTVAASFRVDNTGNATEEVAFSVSEFSGTHGTAPFRPPLRLHPPRFVLGPLESQLVSVRLPLIEGLFQPNRRYSATLTVLKRETFDLTIDVVTDRAAESSLIVRPLREKAGSG